MKTNILSLFVILFISKSAVSQTKTYTLSVSENSKIKAIKKVSNSGFIIHTLNHTAYGIPRKESSLTYFDKNLNERWNIKPLLNAPLISSNETPYVYQILRKFSMKEYYFISGNYDIIKFPFITFNRIDEAGTQDTFTIHDETTKKNFFLAAASDDQYLYYLSYNTPDNQIQKYVLKNKINNKLVPKKLFLKKIAHTSKSFKEAAIDIEFNENGDINFLGCNNGYIYIYQKILSEDGKQIKYLIYVIDNEGHLSKKFHFKYSTPDYFAPLDYNRELNGAYSPVENFVFKSQTEYYPILYSLSNLEIDFKSGKIFMYGMTNKNRNCFDDTWGEVITGLYLNIYSLDGVLLHSINKDVTDLIIENKGLKRPAPNRLRAISFDILKDNLYRIHVGTRSNEFTSFILSNNNIISSHTDANNYDFYGELIMFDFPKEITLKMNLMASKVEAPASYISYISQYSLRQSKKVRYLSINNGMTYVLVKYEKMRKETQLTFTLFN